MLRRVVGAREIWAELVAASREALPCRCLCCRSLIESRSLIEGRRLIESRNLTEGRSLIEEGEICSRCRRELLADEGHPLLGDGIDDGFASVGYEGPARRLIAALKFSRLLDAADICAELIVERTPPTLLTGTVVPAPASPMRSLTRGFDPAEAIATRVAARAGLPCRPLVLRRRDLRRQRGRDRRTRLGRPPIIRAVETLDEEVLLVDDVSTTGATLDASARALRQAGATRVRAIVFATVPPPSRKIR